VVDGGREDMAVELLWKRIIMATGFYERLSSLDHSFLLFEGPTTYMHV